MDFGLPCSHNWNDCSSFLKSGEEKSSVVMCPLMLGDLHSHGEGHCVPNPFF